MRYTALPALAAALLAASPTFAQVAPAPLPVPVTDTAVADAKGLVLQPLTLTKVADLDFGTVIGSAVAGSVTIDADGALRATSGGVTPVATAPGNRAEFAGAGTPLQPVTLTLNAPTLLVSTSNASDTLVVTSMDFDSAGSSRVVGADSTFTTYVGGVFAIAANQPNGLYTAQFDVTADYQ